MMQALFCFRVFLLSLWCFGGLALAAPIAIDAGHTPGEPGAVSPSGRVEYVYNREFAMALTRRLRALGAFVIEVAAEGQEILPAQRTQHLAATALFASIHHDSIPQAWIDAGRRGEFSGFSLFVSEKNPAYLASFACAQAVGDALLASGEHPSLYHATPVSGENRMLLDVQRGIHRFDDLIVLRTAPGPALLIEVGVIANPDEARRLADAGTIDRLAAAIAGALQTCRRAD